MKYFLSTVLILGIGVTFYWWSLSNQTIQKENIVTIDSASTTTPIIEKVSETEVKHQTYRNDAWGISFKYPNDWETTEGTFRAASSLFNVIIQPTSDNPLPRPIFISINPESWGRTMIDKYYKEEADGKKISVAGIKSYYFESTDMGLPLYSYLIPINNSYWINIAGKKGYEDVLDQVLESFIITPVDVPAKN